MRGKGGGGVRLDELDKDEFRSATRKLWPGGYTEDDFERGWAEFQETKRRKAMQ